MDLLYKEKSKPSDSLLSATRPKPILKTTADLNAILQTRLRQKQFIKVYKDDAKFYIERSTAFALGIIDKNSMMNSNAEYIELNNTVHDILKKDERLVIEYTDMIKNNGPLSTINPGTVLDTKEQNNQQISAKPKQLLKVYVDGAKYYIDSSAAHTLGITKVRAVKLGGPHFIELTVDILNKLKNDNRLEIELEEIIKKFKLKVYNDGNSFYIDNSAAYALGFLSVEDFHKANDKYFPINEHLLKGLSITYEIEMNALNLEINPSAKTK